METFAILNDVPPILMRDLERIRKEGVVEMKVLKTKINVLRDDDRISIKLNSKYDIMEKYQIIYK